MMFKSFWYYIMTADPVVL